MALGGSQLLRAQDSAPVQPCRTAERTGPQGQKGGKYKESGDEGEDGDGDKYGDGDGDEE